MQLSFLNSAILSNSWNWTGILIFLAVAFIYGFLMGRNRLVAMILGTYFSLILTQALPWAKLTFLGIKQVPTPTVQIFIFLALILAFYFLIPHSALRQTLRLGGRSGSNWWQALIFSILQIGLILEVAVSFLPAKIVNGLNPLAKSLFIGPWPEFLWVLVPILALMFLRSSRHYDVD